MDILILKQFMSILQLEKHLQFQNVHIMFLNENNNLKNDMTP